MIFSTSQVYSDLGNTGEITKDLSPEAMNEFQKNMTKKFNEVLDGQVTLQLYNGAFSFACYFISIFLWSFVGNKCIYKLKEKYFYTILKQEQSWFDSNNPLEISTKVNSEL